METRLVELFLVVTILTSVGTVAVVMAFVCTASRSPQPNVKFCGVLLANPFAKSQTPPLSRQSLHVAGAAVRCLMGRRRHWVGLVAAAIVVYLLFWNWGVFSHYAEHDKSLRSHMAAQHATKHAIDAGAGGGAADDRQQEQNAQLQATADAKDPVAALLKQQHQLKVPKTVAIDDKRHKRTAVVKQQSSRTNA